MEVEIKEDFSKLAVVKRGRRALAIPMQRFKRRRDTQSQLHARAPAGISSRFDLQEQRQLTPSPREVANY